MITSTITNHQDSSTWESQGLARPLLPSPRGLALQNTDFACTSVPSSSSTPDATGLLECWATGVGGGEQTSDFLHARPALHSSPHLRRCG